MENFERDINSIITHAFQVHAKHGCKTYVLIQGKGKTITFNSEHFPWPPGDQLLIAGKSTFRYSVPDLIQAFAGRRERKLFIQMASYFCHLGEAWGLVPVELSRQPGAALQGGMDQQADASITDIEDGTESQEMY